MAIDGKDEKRKSDIADSELAFSIMKYKTYADEATPQHR